MKKLRFIRKELIKLYGKEKTNTIVKSAQAHYQSCLILCNGATKGELMHLKNTILPTASFYKALLEADGENALENTRAIIIGLCEKGAKVLNAVLKLPGMKAAFMKIMPKMALKNFGRECGFDYEGFEASKSVLRMDMIKCPYVKYAIIFNAAELIPIFCESDFATYGGLSGIAFNRTETLGTGGSKCDFRFSRTDK